MSSYLVEQVDRQLELTSETVANRPTRQMTTADGSLPSDYYILYRLPDGSEQHVRTDATVERYGIPRIPDLTNDEASEAAGTPFTVPADPDVPGVSADTEWRVMPLVMRGDSGVVASAYVALPLTDIQETVRLLGRTLAWSALAIALVGAVVAYLAVGRALRPLREIEATAAGIAAGDLTRRVEPAPPTTEVGSLADSLNAMLAQIERAFAASEASETRMRRFVSDASHELRTPVATIRGYGELYRMGALTEKPQLDDTMGRIEDSASRMGALVADLLSLARLDEGRPLRTDPVDLLRLARDSAQDLHALDPGRTVRVVDAQGEEPPSGTSVRVTGDEDRLRQVLANLIGNVARHTPQGTPAEIAVVPDDGAVVLEVRDHGPGVSEQDGARIFERFYRADSSRTRESGGSGLGMAIVAAIVAAHHGTVAVSRTECGGLTVRVTLPGGDYDSLSLPDPTSAAGPEDPHRT
ncbi:two-component sensor histidine kinase [Paraoerskovia sediminicola]|uniref:histidine kinase n=1 Tax=Paraoerskovia sediminicola TaxID=1138587 RepID=A0ABN6XCX9_9CELL|nr:HAMP domain-containing sensor histidine kinase [Paraoerskovia sediminicola]BDZ42654.1 two-component sensor histidine kinase [Paraoerskovia sediminicola]